MADLAAEAVDPAEVSVAEVATDREVLAEAHAPVDLEAHVQVDFTAHIITIIDRSSLASVDLTTVTAMVADALAV